MKNGKIFSLTGKFFTIILLYSLFTLTVFAQEKIVFGITKTVFRGNLKVFTEWKNYLEKEIKIPIEIKFSRTYSEMSSMIQRGEVDIAYIGNMMYIKLKSKNIVQLLAIPQSDDQKLSYSYIIAKKGNTYNSLFDFKNKLFAYPDPESHSGVFAPSYKLLKNNIRPNLFFSKIIYTYEHSESINAVLESFVDGASIDSLVYEQFIKKYPKKSSDLYIVEKLGPYTMSPIVSYSFLDDKIYQKIQKSLINMHNDKKGKEILNTISLSKLKLPENETYKNIQDILDFIESY